MGLTVLGRPFKFTTDADITPSGGDSAIHDAVQNAIFMSPGEMLLNPIGGGLREALFEQRSSELDTLLKTQVKEAIAVLVPFVFVRDVVVRSSDDPEVEVSEDNVVFVTILYTNRITGEDMDYIIKVPWSK